MGSDRLLPLRDLISEDFMRKPDMLDHDGESCLLVIKNGNATGVTIGRATGIFSYVRKYSSNNTHQTSTEWAILPYDNKSGAFSARGDSGSIKDIENAALFLCSDAGNFINGAVMVVDGGHWLAANRLL